MEESPIAVEKGRESSWPDKFKASSDEASWESMTLPSPSPSPTETNWSGKGKANRPTSPVPPRVHSAQLSPVSSNTDINMELSSSSANIHSASSSCADGWSPGCGERDDMEDDSQYDQCERGCDEALAIPKLEPMEDDLVLKDLKAAAPSASMPANESAPGAGQIKQKRPRGRPRKHPLAAAANTAKVAKGRSKTGCITCRKRKKKCDEAKPRCMNCEKNAVVCEGYHEKQVWKSGKERAEEERLRWESLPTITMQPIFHGVETTEDKILWKHYINHFSNVLTVEGEARNAFKDIILQLANRHQGLMHSILAVSSKHIDFGAPYGTKILQENPSTNEEALHQRGEYHHDEAMKRLYEDMAKPMDKDDPEYKTILAARYGQMLCLLLQTRAEGNPRGEHRVHLQAYRNLIQHNPPDDPTLHTFITEFFQYHIYADDLFWHPETMTKRLSSEEWEPTMPIFPPRLIGVADGLFKHLSQITSIKNRIRANMAASVDPAVDHSTLFRASEIDGAIREWTPSWPPGDSRGRLGLLYKQMTWVYLFRTIYPPTPAPARRSTIGSLPVLIAPSMTASGISHRRRASMAAASRPPQKLIMPATKEEPARIGGGGASLSGIPSPTSISSSSSSSSSFSSPRQAAPLRRPSPEDQRITLAVDESLSILESFKPSDPAQTLLLIPCLILGTASSGPSQQQRIRAALKAVRGYTGLRNCDRVLELLEEVWRLMGQGDWAAVWDWQGVARRMDLNFSCA